MANTYNKHGKTWELATDDILQSPDHSGVWIRKIFFQMNSEADGVYFKTINLETAAIHDNTLTNLAFSGGHTITDSSTGNVWSGTNPGDWIRITGCSTAANDGWWYLKTDSSDSIQVVENGDNIDGTHGLTTASGATARIRVYTPETSMYVVNDTIGGSSSIHMPTIDWGPRGRFFHTLSMQAFSGALAVVYIA